MKLRVIFANIYQGLLFEGKLNEDDVFSKFWPSAYTEIFAKLKPDILCLAETPFDTADGKGKFIEELSMGTNLSNFRSDSKEASWVVEGKFYGNAILTRFDIVDYEAILLKNPNIEFTFPNGEHRITHDKTIQKATIKINEKDNIRLFNTHYFPISWFGRRFDDPEFAPIHDFFAKTITPTDNLPTIAAGDFNNSKIEIEQVFPKLFSAKKFVDSVKFTTKDFKNYLSETQLDHILLTPQFNVVHSEIIKIPSDHHAILIDVEI